MTEVNGKDYLFQTIRWEQLVNSLNWEENMENIKKVMAPYLDFDYLDTGGKYYGYPFYFDANNHRLEIPSGNHVYIGKKKEGVYSLVMSNGKSGGKTPIELPNDGVVDLTNTRLDLHEFNPGMSRFDLYLYDNERVYVASDFENLQSVDNKFYEEGNPSQLKDINIQGYGLGEKMRYYIAPNYGFKKDNKTYNMQGWATEDLSINDLNYDAAGNSNVPTKGYTWEGYINNNITDENKDKLIKTKQFNFGLYPTRVYYKGEANKWTTPELKEGEFAVIYHFRNTVATADVKVTLEALSNAWKHNLTYEIIYDLNTSLDSIDIMDSSNKTIKTNLRDYFTSILPKNKTTIQEEKSCTLLPTNAWPNNADTRESFNLTVKSTLNTYDFIPEQFAIIDIPEQRYFLYQETPTKIFNMFTKKKYDFIGTYEISKIKVVEPSYNIVRNDGCEFELRGYNTYNSEADAKCTAYNIGSQWGSPETMTSFKNWFEQNSIVDTGIPYDTANGVRFDYQGTVWNGQYDVFDSGRIATFFDYEKSNATTTSYDYIVIWSWGSPDMSLKNLKLNINTVENYHLYITLSNPFNEEIEINYFNEDKTLSDMIALPANGTKKMELYYDKWTFTYKNPITFKIDEIVYNPNNIVNITRELSKTGGVNFYIQNRSSKEITVRQYDTIYVANYHTEKVPANSIKLFNGNIGEDIEYKTSNENLWTVLNYYSDIPERWYGDIACETQRIGSSDWLLTLNSTFYAPVVVSVRKNGSSDATYITVNANNFATTTLQNTSSGSKWIVEYTTPDDRNKAVKKTITL